MSVLNPFTWPVPVIAVIGVPTVAVLAFVTIFVTEFFPADIQIFVTLPMIGVTAVAAGVFFFWGWIAWGCRRVRRLD